MKLRNTATGTEIELPGDWVEVKPKRYRDVTGQFQDSSLAGDGVEFSDMSAGPWGIKVNTEYGYRLRKVHPVAVAGDSCFIIEKEEA